MQTVSRAVTMVIPLLAAIYTWNYGRWAWREGLIAGAAALFLLSVATVAVPLLMILLQG